MIVCLVWFSLMTRKGEIGMKSSAPGDSRGAGDFLYPLYAIRSMHYMTVIYGVFSHGFIPGGCGLKNDNADQRCLEKFVGPTRHFELSDYS
jgi:hypothetical protein